MKLEQAARQALDALEALNPYPASKENKRFDAITALREALAEQAEQEPVAKVCHDLPSHIGWNPHAAVNKFPEGMLLYAAPVRTKDLTDDEIDMVLALVGSDAPFHAKYRAVIAAYREKNK